jgi:peptidoglycan/LPS O-acetylase OafA/YrhL
MESPYSGNRESGYRPDIDGLRAIAIVLVVFNHVGVPHFKGGFIGVDIFFVISGYLITGNISREIAKKRFSIAGFYERRLRRIAPALYVFLALTSIPVLFVYPPTELVKYAQSLMAALFSYANLYFWTQAGYFTPIRLKILLHTWSLGVEEQFYLTLPLAMSLLANRPKRVTQWMIAIGAAASLASALYLTPIDRDLSFYMPYTRAWELLAGSALAMEMIWVPKSRAVREAWALAGLALLVFCTLTYSEFILFPGRTAIAPVAAAVLLLSVGIGGRTTTTSFLYSKPVIFIGLISYSMYLWHLPLVQFIRPGMFPNAAIHIAVIFGLSVVAGTLSWWLVEQPFRTGRWKKLNRAQVFQVAGAGAAALTGLACVYIFSSGLPSRFPPAAVAVGSYLYAPQEMGAGRCFEEKRFSDFDIPKCLTPVKGKENILLLGDSHAAALWYGLSHAAPPQVNLMEAAFSSCPARIGDYDATMCGQARRFIFETWLPAHRPDKVILSERWVDLAKVAEMRPAVEWFQARGIPVIVIGPVQEYNTAEPMLLALELKWNRPGYTAARMKTIYKPLDDAVAEQLRGMKGVQYASAWKAICPNDVCQQYADPSGNVPMMVDDDHLSNAASLLVVQRMQRSGELTF